MNTLLYFDFYAPKPSLFIKKQDSFKTILGLILSIITILALISIFVFIFFCFINDTGLSVLYEKASKSINMIDLNLSKNIFFYHLNNKSGQIVDKRLIRTYPYLTISTSSETKYELLKETNCDINKLIQSNKEYKNLLDFDISQFNCITFQNNSDAVMQRRHSPFKNSYINLFVAKCQNDSGLNITDCFPENEINEFIENNTLYINLFLESSAINHHNYSYPLTKKYYQNSMRIPKDFIFSYSFFWRKIEYYTRNSILLFNYLFQSSSFILDHTIKDKNIYSTKTNFYVDKTIGKIQFLITVEYVDSYIRKYKTLIESLTILMSGFNIITNFCYILNHLCTKSYIYCTIFEPIVYDSKMKTLRENLDKKSSFKNINSINNSSLSPSPSSSKIQLVQNQNINYNNQILKLNNKTYPLQKKKSIPINSEINVDPIKTFKIQKEEFKNILTDIETKKISDKVNFYDNFLFFLGKLFHSNNKKQMYLRRLEKLLREELSLDHLYQQFKKIKLLVYSLNEIKKPQSDKWNVLPKNQFSINVSSINAI